MNLKSHHRRIPRALPSLVLVCLAVLTLPAEQAEAQEPACPTRTVPVSRPACPSGDTFDPSGPFCRSESGGGVWGRSHCRIDDCNTCRADETLDRTRGLCTRTVTITLGRRACAPGWTFNPATGSCESRSGWPTYARAHCRLEDCNTCTEEEVLDTGAGRCCPAG